MEVTERVTYKGEVLVPLAEDELLAAATRLMDEQVEAIAVCFLHAYANPTHEARAARLIRQRWPNVAVTASHELTREWRGEERTSTPGGERHGEPLAPRDPCRPEPERTPHSGGGARPAGVSSRGSAAARAARA